MAAVISEPLQGAGGVWPPVEGYLPGLRRLCDTHGALLILDEVICGFGRMGEWFGAQYYGVTPDIMTFAKGVTSGYQPLAGVSPVAAGLRRAGGRGGLHAAHRLHLLGAPRRRAPPAWRTCGS